MNYSKVKYEEIQISKNHIIIFNGTTLYAKLPNTDIIHVLIPKGIMEKKANCYVQSILLTGNKYNQIKGIVVKNLENELLKKAKQLRVFLFNSFILSQYQKEGYKTEYNIKYKPQKSKNNMEPVLIESVFSSKKIHLSL